MGHLINPLSLQIKHYGSWKLSSNQYLKRDFKIFFFIDQYFQKMIQSIIGLKCFFNKFFFFELKHFIKDNSLFLFLCFKFLNKKSFKFNGLHTLKMYAYLKRTKRRKRKKKPFRQMLRNFRNYKMRNSSLRFKLHFF